MSDFLQGFARDFAALDQYHLDGLDRLYSPDIQFTDPLHQINGLPRLREYFAGLYANISQPCFDFHGIDPLAEGEGYLRWSMSYRHPRLDGGREIRVEGCSHLLWREARVYRHRDYFDAGALLYEHLPLMGSAIHWLKRRLG